MDKSKKRTPSRAFDPTYKPRKTWAEVAAEMPHSKGARMLADAETKGLLYGSTEAANEDKK